MTCLSHYRDGKTRPFLKGQLELSLPSFIDIVGYCYTDTAGPTGGLNYHMLIGSVNDIIAKDRPGQMTQTYGPVVTNADFSEWLNLIQRYYDEMTGTPSTPTPTPSEED